MFKNMQTCHGKVIDVQKYGIFAMATYDVQKHVKLFRCSKTWQTCHDILNCSKPFANLPRQTKDVEIHGKLFKLSLYNNMASMSQKFN